MSVTKSNTGSLRRRLFITGTDTDVGKTEIALALLHLARQRGFTTAAMKPVAAGCQAVTTPEGKTEWQNEDARRLQQACTLPLLYHEVNPVALTQAAAPHLAAQIEKRTITIDRLVGFTHNLFGKKADITLIEGAGGWRVPLSHRELLSQYVQQLNLLQPPTAVVLVVGLRLGCLNHALLTAEAILRDKVPLAGWVANCIDEHMPLRDENIKTLEALLPAPCLGVVPFLPTPDTESIASRLQLDVLLR